MSNVISFPTLKGRESLRFTWDDGEYFILDTPFPLDRSMIGRVVMALAVFDDRLKRKSEGNHTPNYFQRSSQSSQRRENENHKAAADLPESGKSESPEKCNPAD